MLFLYAESRETMMHVGGLLPFTPPPDAPPGFLRGLVDELRAGVQLRPPWNLKLKNPTVLKSPVHYWVEDPKPDIAYHLRRSALPSPGDERELGVLVSRLHGTDVDFHRSPWEAHLIEGLQGGRFALYAKVHHSLVDGFTAMRLLQRSFTTDPDDRSRPFFFTLEREPGARGGRRSTGGLFDSVKEQFEAARDVASVVRDIVRTLREPAHDIVGPLQAPMCILNGRIGRARRFATQQYRLDLFKALAKAAGATLNDIVLTLTGATLRRFLLELNALPSRPLIAMIPVNVRPKDDPGGGNAVGSMLASLGTDVADPVARLEAVMASTRAAKAQLQGMSRNAIVQLSALMLLPSGLQQVSGTSGRLRPQFNVVISNVPGPEQPLYFRGARLEAVYPLSIPIHGQALNITCQSYAGTLNFGFTGCRDTLPHLQHLAVYMGDAVEELSKALGVTD
ncbi:MAG: wax ester/triacylglycerol synthase family O-acyltransferase [Deltaproteobacteria bacterium]|nr:MAG: wax ester/triacylglycerol synthase family O-acyltransferase [Deltaproteobacteria bacterium]